MPMSLPNNISQNIDETDFAKNSPMGFNITQPRLDLVPSFTITGGDGDEYRREDTEDVEDDTKEKSEAEQLPLEPQIYPKAETVRMRREASAQFPDIFSQLSSSSPFSISFPAANLQPGSAMFRFSDPIQEKLA